MPAAVRKNRARKVAKDSGASRQTSLLDAFGNHALSRKGGSSTSAADMENSSIAGEDVIDIPSSDAEPLLSEVPVDSSSPITADDDEGRAGPPVRVNLKFGPTSQAGGSREAPIVVADSSPAASPLSKSALLVAPPPPPKPYYSIFAPRKQADGPVSPHKHHGKKPPAPFPDATMQHVRGPQCTFDIPLALFDRCDFRRTPSSVEADPSIYSRLVRGSATSITSITSSPYVPSSLFGSEDDASRERCLSGIPDHHRHYPAISRFLDAQTHSLRATSTFDDSHLLWNDKWRPKRAEEVLGNERSALYLRDWLLALKLQIHGSDYASDKKGKPKKTKGSRGKKRRRIIRDVERKRRRRGSEESEASLTADETEEDPLDVIDEPEDDPAPPKRLRLKRAQTDETLDGSESNYAEQLSEQPPSSSPTSDDVSPFSYTPLKLRNTIRNTILLTGPPGCGKTAAVYACAEELGWDVFEVYPGIGERSGAALQKLIGEVGKNHLVKQTRHQPKAEAKSRAKAVRNFFAMRVVSDDETEDKEVETGDPTPEECVAPALPEATEVSQSVVLVEEVDVLFREDANFWPTMIKIIKECRRPVIMTCNDTLLVPLQDLPLESTLHFAPCPTSLAVSYMRVLSLAERRVVEPDAAKRLFKSSDIVTYADTAVHPRAASPVQSDLRRAINHLQFGAGFSAPAVDGPSLQDGTMVSDQSLAELRRLARTVELRSYVDSGLCRPKSKVLRELLASNSSSCVDETVGYQHLLADPNASDLPVTFSTYTHDKTIIDHLPFGQLHPLASDNPSHDTADPPALHTSHCVSLLPVLDRLHIPREQLIRDPTAIFLDYEPCIRHMVDADDALAKIASSLTGRQTRNSQRSQSNIDRWLYFDDDERGILSRTAFDLNFGIPPPADVDAFM